MIHRAVAVAGSEDKLRALLGVSWPQLQAWLDARAAVPTTVFLKLVDLLERLPEPAEQALHPFLARDYVAMSREQVCESALDAALRVAGCDLGNVQLLDSSGVLRISAQRGFERPFLDFFAEVKGAESACGVALILGRQYSVSDVQAHPVFSGTACDVMLEAGARAVESSPIMSSAGVPLGMLSVHHREPGTPDECVLAVLARIARRAGALLDSMKIGV